MQAVVEVEHHGNIVAGGLELHRFDKRIQRHVLKMHFRDVDDKRRAFLLCGGEQRAQEVGVEHVKRAQRIAVLSGVRKTVGKRNQWHHSLLISETGCTRCTAPAAPVRLLRCCYSGQPAAKSGCRVHRH
jgi:hypothetical protein